MNGIQEVSGSIPLISTTLNPWKPLVFKDFFVLRETEGRDEGNFLTTLTTTFSPGGSLSEAVNKAKTLVKTSQCVATNFVLDTQIIILCNFRCGVANKVTNGFQLYTKGLCDAYSDRIFPSAGVHPTRSIYEKWRDRKKLAFFEQNKRATFRPPNINIISQGMHACLSAFCSIFIPFSYETSHLEKLANLR